MTMPTPPDALGRKPPPAGAEHAGGVGLVEIEHGAVALGQPGQRRHVGAVAVHAEHRLGDDEAQLAGVGCQQFLQVAEVVVAVADLLQSLAAGVEAGVVEAIGEHQRPVRTRCQFEQRRQHRAVELESRGENQRRLGALEGGEPGFEVEQLLRGAGDEARGARARAVAARPGAGTLDDLRMARKAEVVVGRNVDQPRIGHTQKSALAGRLEARQARCDQRVEVSHGRGTSR